MMGGAVIPQLQHELSEVLTSVLKKFLVNLKVSSAAKGNMCNIHRSR